MSSFGTVPLKEIWAMLEHCAPGFERRERTHNWLVTWNGRSFPRLPVGPHGNRQNPGIEIGHIRQMVRMLGIDVECVRQHVGQF